MIGLSQSLLCYGKQILCLHTHAVLSAAPVSHHMSCLLVHSWKGVAPSALVNWVCAAASEPLR